MLRRLLLPTLLVALLGCHHETQSRAAAELPSRDQYVGSERCAECHEKQADHWQDDWHARALSPAKEPYVVGQFDGQHYKGASSEAWMSRNGNLYVMKTSPADGVARDYEVQWVIGGKRMQDDVAVMDDGRWQVLPVYFHVTGNGEWVDYNEKKQGVVTPAHPFFWTNFRRTANHECLGCHVSGLDARYDRGTHQWSTHFADAGVACESCHGPGARHAASKSAKDIVRADELEPERELAVCGQCHGPREPIFPLLDREHQYRPGDAYEERFQAFAIVDGLDRSGEFWADGRPSSSSFEYQGLLESKCWTRGKATCLTCHTAPHDRHEANEIKDGVNASCRECHAQIAANAAQHSHHKTAAAQSCVACHMPPLLSGVLDEFPDHTLDIPNPRNTAAHEVPNACNHCHAKQSPQAMQQAMASWWPDIEQRQARRSRLADAIDEKTRESSRPALIAVLNDREETPLLRGAVALLLGQRFPEGASAVLVPHLTDPDPLLRARVVDALAYAKATDARDALARMLNDPAIKVRERAAVVLSTLGDERGDAALEQLASNAQTAKLVWPHLLIGIRAGQHGDMQRAEAEMNRALDLAPYLPDALVFLGDIEMRTGRPQQARSHFEEALRFAPQHRGALGRLAAMAEIR